MIKIPHRVFLTIERRSHNATAMVLIHFNVFLHNFNIYYISSRAGVNH